MQRAFLSLAWAVIFLLTTSLALAAGPYVPVPNQKGRSSSLQIRFVRYTGGSTGQLIVDVRNPGKRSQRFSAEGLFFVPKGDPEKAPQRLGAAGPFEYQKGKAWATDEAVVVPPRKSVRLRLQVFCLDSHRSSPDATQGFRVARKRLPKSLQHQITAGAKKAYKASRGNRPAAASRTQSHVWETRNKKWVVIEGERKNEQAKPARPSRHPVQQQRRRPSPRR